MAPSWSQVRTTYFSTSLGFDAWELNSPRLTQASNGCHIQMTGPHATMGTFVVREPLTNMGREDQYRFS